MDDLDVAELRATASDPTLIPAIHNYCDRRCERCRFCDRCSVYRMERRPGEFAPESSGHANTAAVIRSLKQAVRMMRQLAETYGMAQDATSEELEDAGRDEQALHARTIAHPLVRSAKDYFLTTMPIVRALRPFSLERADEAVIEAVETIEAVAHLIASKVFRAMSGLHEDDYDAGDLQDDANGSAKIARLLIADSRAAWTVLMERGRATANGVPAQLLRRLDEIDAGLAEHFPRAMAFLRPGFDTEDGNSAGVSVGEPVAASGGSNA